MGVRLLGRALLVHATVAVACTGGRPTALKGDNVPSVIINEYTEAEKLRSQLSDRQTHPAAPTGVFDRMYMVSLARVALDAGRSRPWRITLSRLDRVDGAYIVQGHSTLYPGESYQYLYGVLPIPAVPPRRTNPIYGNLDPSNGAFLNDNFVEIAWGTQGGAAPSRLLAQWPSEGASLVVSGSYVEVWGAGAIQSPGSPPVPEGSRPMFQAAIDPIDGVAPGDAGAELSLTDFKLVQEPAAGGTFVTNRGDVSNLFAGWTVEGTTFPASLRGSAVQDVAPFDVWSATIERFTASGTMPIVTLFTGVVGPAVDVLDGSFVDPAGAITASPGNVAIILNTTLAPTFVDVETQINGVSSIIKVTVPSANPAFVVASAPNSWTAQLAVPFNPIAGADQGRAGADAASSIAPLTEGAVFYVPDFARRVRVALFQGVDALNRVPLAGDPQATVVFYNDRGLIVHGWRQGLVLNAGVPVSNDAPVWHPVPDEAVLMGVYGDPAITNNIARVHWRIAP